MLFFPSPPQGGSSLPPLQLPRSRRGRSRWSQARPPTPLLPTTTAAVTSHPSATSPPRRPRWRRATVPRAPRSAATCWAPRRPPRPSTSRARCAWRCRGRRRNGNPRGMRRRRRTMRMMMLAMWMRRNVWVCRLRTGEEGMVRLMSRWKSYEDLRGPAMRMRLTKTPWLLLLLLHIFPSPLHCPQCLSHFVERKAPIPCSDSPLIDLEPRSWLLGEQRDCPVSHRALQSCSGFLSPPSPSCCELGSLLGWQTDGLTMHSYRILPLTEAVGLCCILEPFCPISETSLSWAPWFHKPLIPHKAQTSSLFPEITLFYFSNYFILCCKKIFKKTILTSNSSPDRSLGSSKPCAEPQIAENYLASKNTKFLWGPKNAVSPHVHQSGLLVGTKSRCHGHHQIHDSRWLCWWLLSSKRL